MRRILAPILLLTLLFPSLAYGVTMDDLVKRDGIHYKKFSDVPFMGKVTGRYQGSFRNGKRHGPWVTYFENGQLMYKGTFKDHKKDGLWFRYNKNGQLLSEGLFLDDKTAVKWYRLAAEQGDALAQINLGVMYGRGLGVIQDNIYAHMWANLAAVSGDGMALILGRDLRDGVAKLMASDQIAKAQKLARECVRKNYKGC